MNENDGPNAKSADVSALIPVEAPAEYDDENEPEIPEIPGYVSCAIDDDDDDDEDIVTGASDLLPDGLCVEDTLEQCGRSKPEQLTDDLCIEKPPEQCGRSCPDE